MAGLSLSRPSLSKVSALISSHPACSLRPIVALFLAVLFTAISDDASAEEIWNLPRPVLGYESYLDVSPVRYMVPDGISVMNFTFQTSKSFLHCPQESLKFLLQRGGLPLITRTNSTFPDNFLVNDDPSLHFSLRPGVLFSFGLNQPLPGSWYVVAYHEGVDTKIRQKGFNDGDKCIYSYMSQLQLGPPVKAQRINIMERHMVTVGPQDSIFSFKVPRSTSSFQVIVDSCDPEDCSLVLSSLSSQAQLPQPAKKVCTNGTMGCALDVPSPSLQSLQFVYISSERANQRISFTVTVMGCPSELVKGNCASMGVLDRIQALEPFTALYGYIERKTISFTVGADIAPYVVVPFDILEPNDVGATLKWRMQPINFTDAQVLVCGALLYDRLPELTDHFDVCQDLGWSVRANYSEAGNHEVVQYVPYPRAGLWHILLQATCFDDKGQRLPKCPSIVFMDVSLEVQPCIDGGCRDRGSCEFVTRGSDLIAYTSCQCDADFQGYGCTDDTNAPSPALQKAGAYLLTLSNLFFVPAIVIATRRGFVVEAFVYFYTMFFSTFYHACDGERVMEYRLCIMKYDVLQLSDFFGSACSLWFTIVAMASIPYRHISPVLQVAGPLGLFIGVVYDRHSLCLIAVPIFCGLGLIICSWGHKMYKRRKLYPSPRRYLLFLMPGVVLAAVGAAVFSFVETKDNYKYVHSFWHVSIALCICFLLPPKRVGEKGELKLNFD
ncbi:post-GPI attachment to proteins factor 6 [Aplysia californica]|uniref:Post-GPI attachment to proteins factor 6 n=1 Tax=Aplysia californica TaxID=6500 RepID=A0ABM1ADP3_APLCA|nr:post-GPI attachment to proteins factor 6 [Aplysia californica]